MLKLFFYIHTFCNVVLSRLLGIGYLRVNLDRVVQTASHEHKDAKLNLIHDNIRREPQGWSFSDLERQGVQDSR